MLQTEYFPLSIFTDTFFKWITELSFTETVVYFVQPQCIESAVNSCITICHKFPQLEEKWLETCTRKLNVRLKRSRLANYSLGPLPSKMNVFKTSGKVSTCLLHGLYFLFVLVSQWSNVPLQVLDLVLI